jgi:hypothetical protein
VIELCSYALKACERPEDDFVYLAEEVDELIEKKDKRIAELEAIIQGRDELIDNAVSSRTADIRVELNIINAVLELKLEVIKCNKKRIVELERIVWDLKADISELELLSKM